MMEQKISKKSIDSVGATINNILILEYYQKDKRGYFNCKCFCGHLFSIRCDSMGKGNNTASCGCLTGKLIANQTSCKDNNPQLNSLYNSYLHNANKRNILWNISKEEFSKLINLNCYYCGIEPRLKWVANRNRKNYFTDPLIYNGVDRIDSSEDYTVSNVVTCCYICNHIKSDHSLIKFNEWIHNLIVYKTLDNNVSFKKELILPEMKIQNFENFSSLKKEEMKIGQIFYYLTYLGKVKSKDRKPYKFQCVCGKICFKRFGDLKNGISKSCGCKRTILASANTTKPDGFAQYNFIFIRYKQAAKKRDLKMDLSFDSFKEIIKQNCHYCGAPPQLFDLKKYGRKNYNAVPIFYNGVDRKNSNLGYSIQNCVPCCSICNRGKMDTLYETFINHLDKLVTYHG